MTDETAFTSLGWQALIVMKRLKDTRKEYESDRQRGAAERGRGRPVEGPFLNRKPKTMRRKL